MERIDRDKSAIEGGARSQERPDRFPRHILAAGERKVRMPGAKIRLNARGQRGVRHAFVQLEKMRMTVTNAEPNDPRAAFRREGSNPVEREEKAREPNREQLGVQSLLRFCRHIPEESEREMKLLRGQPTHAGQKRIHAGERLRNQRGYFQTNEKTLRSHRAGSPFPVATNRRVAQASQPAGRPLLRARFVAGF